jgi:hypothetical protein
MPVRGEVVVPFVVAILGDSGWAMARDSGFCAVGESTDLTGDAGKRQVDEGIFDKGETSRRDVEETVGHFLLSHPAIF